MVPVRRGHQITLLLLLATLSVEGAFLPAEYLSLGLLVVPLLGVVGGLMLPAHVRGKTWGLAVSASTLSVAISMAFQFHWSEPGYQFIIGGPKINVLGTQFVLAVDQISLPLILLTAALHPLAVTASLRTIHVRSREHYVWMNLLLVLMLGTFMAGDLLLFYVFFEASLVPLFFIIGMWGGHERRRAARTFFLYTFAGSVFMLVGVVYLGMRAGTFYIPEVVSVAQRMMDPTERFWVLMAFLAAFGVKTPLFPLHTWLPLAHTEAPTGGSVDLAGLVLKLGTYGLLRVALPVGLITATGDVLFPVVLKALGVVCLIGIIYGALVAWAQTDMKKLVAYSSVSHLGFCVLGMLALNPTGMAGSVLYMVNHGITSGALFLIVGMIYNRYHTRDLRELSGLGRAMPKMAFFLILFVMASVGLPGLNGFVSEFLTILGAFTSDQLGIAFGSIAAIGIVLGAIYMLYFAACLLFGPLKYRLMSPEEERHATVHPAFVTGGDLTAREVFVLTPLAAAVIVLGVYPAPLLRSLRVPLDELRHAPAIALAESPRPSPAATTPPAVASAGLPPAPAATR